METASWSCEMTPEDVIAKLARGGYGKGLWPQKHWTGKATKRRTIPPGTDPMDAYFRGYTLREIKECLGVDHNFVYALLNGRRR